MATYGYSTPYTGTRQPALPPGYMEAATAPGRNLAAGIAQLGAGIGQAIQRYQTSKAENEAATQTFETLSGMAQQALASDPSYQALQNYYETGQLPQGVTEADLQRFSKKAEADRSMLNRMVGLGEKFGDMSVAKKKAAIGDMAMVLQQYQQRGEAEMKREVNQLALDKARREAATTRNIDELTRRAMGLPTMRTVSEPVVDVIQANPWPEEPTTAAPAQPTALPTVAETAVVNRYLQQAGVAGEQLRREAAAREAANVMPPETGQYFGFGGLGGAAVRPIPLPTMSPMEREVALERFRRTSAQETQNINELRRQADILGRAAGQTLKAPAQAPTPQPEQAPEPAKPMTENRLRMVSRQEAVPYDELRQGLAQFATERGMNAEAFGSIDKVLEMRGIQKPLKVESQQLPGGALVIRADNKIEILPPAKPVEGKPLNDAQGKSVQFAAGMRLNNDTINKVIESGYVPGELTEFGATPSRLWTENRRIYTSARDAWIENFLRDRSGAAVTPEEYPAAIQQYFPLPGDSAKEIKRKAQMRQNAYNSTRAKIGENADYYLNQAIGGAEEVKAPQGSAVYRLVRGKEIQPVQ